MLATSRVWPFTWVGSITSFSRPHATRVLVNLVVLAFLVPSKWKFIHESSQKVIQTWDKLVVNLSIKDCHSSRKEEMVDLFLFDRGGRYTKSERLRATGYLAVHIFHARKHTNSSWFQNFNTEILLVNNGYSPSWPPCTQGATPHFWALVDTGDIKRLVPIFS